MVLVCSYCGNRVDTERDVWPKFRSLFRRILGKPSYPVICSHCEMTVAYVRLEKKEKP